MNTRNTVSFKVPVEAQDFFQVGNFLRVDSLSIDDGFMMTVQLSEPWTLDTSAQQIMQEVITDQECEINVLKSQLKTCKFDLSEQRVRVSAMSVDREELVDLLALKGKEITRLKSSCFWSRLWNSAGRSSNNNSPR